MLVSFGFACLLAVLALLLSRFAPSEEQQPGVFQRSANVRVPIHSVFRMCWCVSYTHAHTHTLGHIQSIVFFEIKSTVTRTDMCSESSTRVWKALGEMFPTLPLPSPSFVTCSTRLAVEIPSFASRPGREFVMYAVSAPSAHACTPGRSFFRPFRSHV